VPLARELQGNFTGDLPIYDPLTTCGYGSNAPCAVDSHGNPIITRTQFSSNIIPSARINQAASAYIGLWPAPSLPGTSNNLVSSLPNKENQDQFHVKVNHTFNDRTNFFARLSREYVTTVSPTAFPRVTSYANQISWNAAMGLNYTPSAATNIDLKLGFNRNSLPQWSPITGVDRVQFLQTAGITGLAGALPSNSLPGIGFSDYDFNAGSYLFSGPHNTVQGLGNYRHIMGQHSLSAGFDIRKNHVRYFPNDGNSGSYSFDNRTTADLMNVNSTGSDLASFMLGYPSIANRIIGDTSSNMFNWNYDFFVGDDWRLTPKLTMNFGVRYEYNQWPHNINDEMSSVQFERSADGTLYAELLHTKASPYPSPYTGQYAPANARREIMDPDFNNFAPRLGLAYMLTPKTVIRSGYAIFYVSTYFQQAEDLRENFPLLAQQDLTLETTYPTAAMQNAFGSSTGAQNTFGGWPQNKRNRNSYSQQWNLAVERELLQNTTLSVTYVGQKGTKLIMYTDINDARLDPTGTLTIAARRPAGHTTDGFILGVLNDGDNEGISSYNALQVKLRKHFSHGVELLSSYNWGKSLDVQSSLYDNSQVQDYTHIHGDYGRSSWDQRQTWVTSFIYQLPVGKGLRFMSKSNRVADAFVGGWRVSGIPSFMTGSPVFIKAGTDVANIGGHGSQRPSLIQLGDPPALPGWQ
jgi:hypothetical protein